MKNYPYIKEYRICTQREFQEFFGKGFYFYGNFFVFKIVPFDHAKLGIIISKKFGNAIYRNYIKRIIREKFRYQEKICSVKILVRQMYPFKFKKEAHFELKRFFCFLSDRYFILMHRTTQRLSLEEAIPSIKMSTCAKLVFFIILFYRKYLSKSFPNACRFQPTCSEYALDALRVYGFYVGLYLIIGRLFRCHPFGPSGYDPIPRQKR